MSGISAGRLILILTLIFIIQAAGLDLMEVDGVRPELLLSAVVFFSLSGRRRVGLWAGIFAGLLSETFRTGKLGAGWLSFALIGLLMSQLSYKVYRESFITQCSLVFLAVLIFGISEYFSNASLIEGISFSGWITSYVIGPAIYSMLIAPLVFPILRCLSGLKK